MSNDSVFGGLIFDVNEYVVGGGVAPGRGCVCTPPPPQALKAMAVTANITSFPSADGDEKDIFFSFSLSKHSTWRNGAANSPENRQPRFPVLPSMATNTTHYEQMMNGTSNASRRII